MGSESLLYYNQSVVKEIGWYPEGGPASASLEQEEEEEEEDELSGCEYNNAAEVNSDYSDNSSIGYLPNALCSWKLLNQRKRWCRCLDADYLVLKVFLLERFLHDILFESLDPNLLLKWFHATATN